MTQSWEYYQQPTFERGNYPIYWICGQGATTISDNPRLQLPSAGT